MKWRTSEEKRFWIAVYVACCNGGYAGYARTNADDALEHYRARQI